MRKLRHFYENIFESSLNKPNHYFFKQLKISSILYHGCTLFLFPQDMKLKYSVFIYFLNQQKESIATIIISESRIGEKQIVIGFPKIFHR